MISNISGQDLRTELLDKMKNIVKGLMTQYSAIIATLFTEDEMKDINKCFPGKMSSSESSSYVVWRLNPSGT